MKKWCLFLYLLVQNRSVAIQVISYLKDCLLTPCMNKILPSAGLTALVLLQSSCTAIRDKLMGMKHSDALVPNYDAIVGNFTYNEQNEWILFYGYDCTQPFDATSALEQMGADNYIERLLEEDISKVRVYARWDEQTSRYNEDAVWFALNCDDFNELGSWLIAENYGDPSDSFTHLSCLYFDSYLTACTDREESYYQCDGYQF